MVQSPPPSMFEDTMKVSSPDSFRSHETLRNLGGTPVTLA